MPRTHIEANAQTPDFTVKCGFPSQAVPDEAEEATLS